MIMGFYLCIYTATRHLFSSWNSIDLEGRYAKHAGQISCFKLFNAACHMFVLCAVGSGMSHMLGLLSGNAFEQTSDLRKQMGRLVSYASCF